MKPGKLIVFEGVSGTGKETQAKLLSDHLSTKKITSRIVFHPSPEVKSLLSSWRKDRNVDTTTEVYLLLADRYDRVRQVIVPALESGEWVISLRNYFSALAYQGKSDVERAWIFSEFSRFEPRADVIFWFDIEPQKAMDRVRHRLQETGEPLGKFETLKHLTEKRNTYKNVLKNIDHIHIDAGGRIEEIHQKIIAHV